MMKKLFLFFTLSIAVNFTSPSLFAQDVKAPSAKEIERNDPEAKKILEKLRKKYEGYRGIKADFELLIEYGDDKEKQTGKIAQSGDMYKVSTNGNEMYCDGATVWVYSQKQNEVQINDFEEDEEDLLSPGKIFKIHENDDDFFYALTQETSKFYHIEFKPRDRDSEYKKMRVEISKSTMNIKDIMILHEDGTRYSFTIKDIAKGSFSPAYFKFNRVKHPGVIEVDMRD